MTLPRAASLAKISFGLALAAVLVLLIVPLGEVRTTEPADGAVSARDSGEHLRNVSLLEWEGMDIVPILLVPAILAAIPLALLRTRHRRSGCTVVAILLVIWTLLTLASVGLLYLPSAAAMVAAAARRDGVVPAGTALVPG